MLTVLGLSCRESRARLIISYWRSIKRGLHGCSSEALRVLHHDKIQELAFGQRNVPLAAKLHCRFEVKSHGASDVGASLVERDQVA